MCFCLRLLLTNTGALLLDHEPIVTEDVRVIRERTREPRSGSGLLRAHLSLELSLHRLPLLGHALCPARELRALTALGGELDRLTQLAHAQRAHADRAPLELVRALADDSQIVALANLDQAHHLLGHGAQEGLDQPW